jgi:glucan phosphoethanolaminetransferase (alkaline phosphatase superfamily)
MIKIENALKEKWHLQILVFLVLFDIYLVFDQFELLNFYTYLFRVKGLFKFSASIFLYLGLTFSMFLLVTSSNKILKVISYLILSSTLCTEISYRIINGYGFTFSEALIVLREFSYSRDALLSFFPHIWFVFPLVMIVSVFLYFITDLYVPKSSWKISVPLSLFFIFLSFYVLKGTSGAQAYPSMFKIPVLTMYAATDQTYTGPRSEVTEIPGKEPEFRNIIYLVDESVRGDMISLNNPSNNDVTPYISSVSANIYNYGIVCSAGNNSGTSQLILRSGVRSEVFPDTGQRSLKNPDIMQFAKKAGFYTIFLDGQKNILQNFMSKYDMNAINYYKGVQEDGMAGEMIDFVLADQIADLLSDTTRRTFTYVVKMGAHFPYEKYYPDDQRIFQPAMKRGELNNDRNRMVNSFKNVIRWNVDHFLKYLVTKLGNRKDYLIIYTSDHGQTLLEHGIVATHADVRNANPLQACVPFFLYFPDSLQKAKFKYLPGNYNRLTHFNIFPSILLMMGYDTAFVRANFDKSIFEIVSEPRYFYTGVFFNNSAGVKTEFDTPEMAALIRELKGTPKKPLIVRGE